MKIEIRHQVTDTVLFAAEEASSMADAAQQAMKGRAKLEGANFVMTCLKGADLEGLNLRHASLRLANLQGVNLRHANLQGANLRCADLCGADLRHADLEGADLAGARLDADLRHANLEGADFEGANLRNADLRYTNLDRARLGAIRAAIRAVLDTAREEVPGLLAAVREGRIDGSAYIGACACLVGTIAKIRGRPLDAMEMSAHSAAERWFFAIRPGMLSASSPVVALTEMWIVEWAGEHEMRVCPDHRCQSLKSLREARVVTPDDARHAPLVAAKITLRYPGDV